MCDTWTGITNPGTRSHKSLTNIGTFLRHLSLHNRWKITVMTDNIMSNSQPGEI